MAITETRQLREPFIEAAGMGITDVGIPLLKQQLDPTKFTGSQFVSPESVLEEQARQDSLQDLQAQQGLAGFQSQLGAQQRGLAQAGLTLSLIHISEPRDRTRSRMPSSA